MRVWSRSSSTQVEICIALLSDIVHRLRDIQAFFIEINGSFVIRCLLEV